MFWVAPYDVPVVFEITHRITHGMSIFTHDKWLFRIGVFSRIIQHAIRSRIHRIHDIGIKLGRKVGIFSDGAFVLNRTGRIDFFQPQITHVEIIAVSGFIAQTPGDYRSMVFIPFVHALNAFQVRLFPGRPVCKGDGDIITDTMRFIVSLIHHIDAILVAKLVPVFVVGIVTGTNGVDVKQFHQFHITKHRFFGDCLSGDRIRLVAVCSFYQNGLAIHEK